MKVLVCGSRTWTDRFRIFEELQKLTTCDAVVNILISGTAKGADQMGEIAARELNWIIEQYPADWNKYGKRAGIIRNQQMIYEGKPDLVLAFWDGYSRGTKHMISFAESQGVEVRIIKP